MLMTNACPICRRVVDVSIDPHGDSFDIECSCCGKYSITRLALAELAKAPTRFCGLLAHWIDDQNSNGNKPRITTYKLGELQSLPSIPFMERAKRLLVYIAERTQQLGERVFLPANVGAKLQAVNSEEINFISRFLRDRGWLDLADPCVLSGKGAVQADEWKRTASSSMQGFVAMWFNDSMNDAWTNGLQKAIADAGYRPMRIDSKEHVNKICDEIIAEIRQSKFLVADFTDHRGGVYFEAGFAMGLGLPVIWACRKDDLAKLHFDTRQYNFIDWETPEELANRLQRRIEAVIGRGPLKPS